MRSAVVRPLRVTLICPVWQAAHVMSSSSSFKPLVVVLREADWQAVRDWLASLGPTRNP